MNMRAAMRDTLALAKQRDHDANTTYFGTSGTDIAHLESMLERANVLYPYEDPRRFSEAKLGRWLGYMQGVLVACGTATLDDVKEINRRHADRKGEV